MEGLINKIKNPWIVKRCIIHDHIDYVLKDLKIADTDLVYINIDKVEGGPLEWVFSKEAEQGLEEIANDPCANIVPFPVKGGNVYINTEQISHYVWYVDGTKIITKTGHEFIVDLEPQEIIPHIQKYRKSLR